MIELDWIEYVGLYQRIDNKFVFLKCIWLDEFYKSLMPLDDGVYKYTYKRGNTYLIKLGNSLKKFYRNDFYGLQEIINERPTLP